MSKIAKAALKELEQEIEELRQGLREAESVVNERVRRVLARELEKKHNEYIRKARRAKRNMMGRLFGFITDRFH